MSKNHDAQGLAKGCNLLALALREVAGEKRGFYGVALVHLSKLVTSFAYDVPSMTKPVAAEYRAKFAAAAPLLPSSVARLRCPRGPRCVDRPSIFLVAC